MEKLTAAQRFAPRPAFACGQRRRIAIGQQASSGAIQRATAGHHAQQFAHISGAIARRARAASFHRIAHALPRATSGRKLAKRLAPHQKPSRVRQQHQPSVVCATSARHRATKRATARARARGEGAPPCAAAPMPESENHGSDTTVGIRITPPGGGRTKIHVPGDNQYDEQFKFYDIHRVFQKNTLLALVPGSNRNYKNAGSSRKSHFQNPLRMLNTLAEYPCGNLESNTCVTLNDSGIQLAVGPQPLWLRNHNSGFAHRIMVKRLATSPHDPLGITDSACKNQLVVVSVQYGPFNPYIPIRSTTIGKSRVAIDPIAMHTSWRSNSDIASVTSIGYPRMSASGESSTTMHRLLHASGSHPISTPYDPKTDPVQPNLPVQLNRTQPNSSPKPDLPPPSRGAREQWPFLVFVLPAPATLAGAPPDGPPPGPTGPDMIDHDSDRGPTRENGSLKVDAPAMQRDAPLSTSTALSGSLDHLSTFLP
ncbi:hypothetical protein F511_30018 [Dorcoceras hygrometricum]|uniref:Uncharacterized protein n=1 Tax=Dorcoceras hygrometricum TaxID=472368 RepID=A0A2Z7BWL1_9LAMI|nr:hypothetical protein F511_30018 [Dorcoceras hygrometricum]